MLHRYSEVLNLPVLCADSGRKAGVVKDIIFGLAGKSVNALLLEQNGLSLKKKVVLLDKLLSLGSDAAIINSSSCVSDMDKASYFDAFRDEGALLGLKVFSKAGGELGIVKDVIFDWKTGKIESFEVSEGMIQDVMQGRKLIPLFGKVELGEEFAVVGSESVEEMEETGGGIRNRLLK
jgi:uncharacterized protein YrrD